MGPSRRRRSRNRTALALIALAVLAGFVTVRQARADPDAACKVHGGWLDGSSGGAIEGLKLYRDLAGKPVVLLGESHDAADHHRWQLHTLAALHGLADKLVIGFEMFPRRVQPALDAWVKGDLTRKAFLKASEWRRVWGYDADLYMPLFDFARLHRVPMVALNVERSLVRRVGQDGWDAVPEGEREGLTDPAPASAAYNRSLAKVYLLKAALKSDKPAHGKAHEASGDDEEKLAEIMERPEFERFVAAQLTWDRAMAEALATAKRKHPGALIAGVIGSGHVARGHGVPHQLKHLGVAGSAVLIPVEAGRACEKVGTDYADAIFTIKSPAGAAEPRKRLRLGVMVRKAEGAALVDRVMPDSVAEAASLKKGDRIVRAAGVDIRTPGELIEVISRQAPGTWLPLTVKRDGQAIELIAKFPAGQEQDS